MSTFATLLVLPSVFAIVTDKRKPQSPSIYPDDPDSVHYDPLVFANEDQIAAQQQGIEQIGHESHETPASPSCHPTGPRLRPSAILLHMLAMRAQRDYNAADTEGDRETSAKSLKSTSIQHQPNVRLMADAPDSKSDSSASKPFGYLGLEGVQRARVTGRLRGRLGPGNGRVRPHHSVTAPSLRAATDPAQIARIFSSPARVGSTGAEEK